MLVLNFYTDKFNSKDITNSFDHSEIAYDSSDMREKVRDWIYKKGGVVVIGPGKSIDYEHRVSNRVLELLIL